MADRIEIAMEPLDDVVDHVRGSPTGRLIVEYGDYECPYSRRATREIERLERRLGDDLRFAFRHFPLTEIHPHALAAARVLERVERDVESGMASGEVLATPRLFIDGVVHRGGYDAATLLEALAQ
jgi:protein-disulfide isomerase